jgi:carbonic anhydrase
VAIDVAALKNNSLLPAGFLVTGMVYDVKTGGIEIVVPPALLRPEGPSK